MSKTAAVADEAAPPAKRGRLKLILIAVAVLAVAAGAYFFFFAGAPAEAAEEVAPEPGPVVALEPISVNLADGHYLKLGLALQTAVVEDSHGEIDGSIALDAAIALFSQRDIAELSTGEAREALKEQLRTTLDKLYHHEVYDVYFTEFVMQ